MGAERKFITGVSRRLTAAHLKRAPTLNFQFCPSISTSSSQFKKKITMEAEAKGLSQVLVKKLEEYVQPTNMLSTAQKCRHPEHHPQNVCS